jgi:hypothetical protein
MTIEKFKIYDQELGVEIKIKINEIIDHLKQKTIKGTTYTEQKTERPEYKENNDFMADMYNNGKRLDQWEEKKEVIREVLELNRSIALILLETGGMPISLAKANEAISKLKSLL